MPGLKTICKDWKKAQSLGHDRETERLRNWLILQAKEKGIDCVPTTLKNAVVDRDGNIRETDPSFDFYIR